MDRNVQRLVLLKQRLILNLFLSAYAGGVVWIILQGASRRDVYLLLGGSLFLYAFMRHVFFFSPFQYGVKYLMSLNLFKWEHTKLGQLWHLYHLPGSLLSLLAGIYFFLQAFLYREEVPFQNEMPTFYFASMAFVFLIIANGNLIQHQNRLLRKNMDELKQYCKEKMVFTQIFLWVAIVAMSIGFALVIWLR